MSSFGKMMKQAVRLRQATDSSLRSKFDSYPVYLQGTLFAGESDIVMQARSISTTSEVAESNFQKRLEIAQGIKTEGNRLLSGGDALLASQKYEAALSVFVCLVNRRNDWKTRGIKDEDISLDLYSLRDETESKRLKSFKVACYLNIALSYARQRKNNVAIAACGSALEVDPTCVKALFRRAHYISSPPSAGATEVNMAIRDLQEASRLAPSNKEVRSLLSQLKRTRHNQLISDKKMFSGLFERGSVIGKEDTVVSAKQQQHQGKKNWFDFRRDMEQNLFQLDKEAREAQSLGKGQEEVELIQENRSRLQNWLNNANEDIEKRQQQEWAQCIDWKNPSDEAIAEANSKGIDLTDPTVIDILEECAEKARASGSSKIFGQNEAQHRNLNEEDKEEDDEDCCNDLEGLLKRVRKARRSELVRICKYLDIAVDETWTELSLKGLREGVVVEVRKSLEINNSSLIVGFDNHQYLFIVAIALIFVAWRLHALGIFDAKQYLWFM